MRSNHDLPLAGSQSKEIDPGHDRGDDRSDAVVPEHTRIDEPIPHLRNETATRRPPPES